MKTLLRRSSLNMHSCTGNYGRLYPNRTAKRSKNERRSQHEPFTNLTRILPLHNPCSGIPFWKCRKGRGSSKLREKPNTYKVAQVATDKALRLILGPVEGNSTFQDNHASSASLQTFQTMYPRADFVFSSQSRGLPFHIHAIRQVVLPPAILNTPAHF